MRECTTEPWMRTSKSMHNFQKQLCFITRSIIKLCSNQSGTAFSPYCVFPQETGGTARSCLKELSLLRNASVPSILILPYWNNDYVLQMDSRLSVTGVLSLF